MKNINLTYIFLLAILSSVLFNEANLNYIQSISQTKEIENQRIVHGSTIWSFDNTDYLPFVKNIMNGDGYILLAEDQETRVRRTPVYPIFYGSFYFIFGEKKAHFLIRYAQVFLFAVSAVLVCLSVFHFFKSKKWAIIAGYIYALNPFILFYCYYTLPEALYLFFVVLSIYLFSIYFRKGKLTAIFLCGIASSIAFLTKPTTGVIIISFLSYFIFDKTLKKNLLPIGILVSGFLTVLSPWVIRNYILTNELIIAEKFYHGSSMTYGRSDAGLRALVACWENPAVLPSENFSNLLLFNINNGKESKNIEAIDHYINNWPSKAFKGYSKEELRSALLLLNKHYIIKQQFHINKPNALRKEYLNLPTEDDPNNAFKLLRKKFIMNAPLQYYLTTPLTYIKGIIFNSFSHHVDMISPPTVNLNSLQLASKAATYLLHVLFYLSVLYFFILSPFQFKFKALLLAPVVVLMLALVYVFRYVENRYLLPIHPFLVITLSFMVSDIYARINNKLSKLIP